MDGLFLVDKPKGMSSADVVSHIKRLFKLDRVGHTGTLDPFATGLLIVCTGKATKLSTYLTNDDKHYEGTIVFGHHYDTYDTTGVIIDSKEVLLSTASIKKEVEDMLGTSMQKPPMYSAIKKGGKKAYKMARKGIDLDLDERQVDIHDFVVTSDLKDNQIDFRTHVSKGTYIRSMAVDLAAKLNTYGALSMLRRTQIASYKLKDAYPLNDIKKEHIIPLEDVLEAFPKLMLNDYMIGLVKNGVVLDKRQPITQAPFVVINQNHDKIALYDRYKKDSYKPVLIL